MLIKIIVEVAIMNVIIIGMLLIVSFSVELSPRPRSLSKTISQTIPVVKIQMTLCDQREG